MKRASIRVQEPTPELTEKIRRARVAICLLYTSLFEDNNSRLKQTVFNKETGIVLTANTEAGKVCFNAIKSLLLQNHICLLYTSYPYEDPVALVCNEEGKLEGLPLNRALRDEDGDIYSLSLIHISAAEQIFAARLPSCRSVRPDI